MTESSKEFHNAAVDNKKKKENSLSGHVVKQKNNCLCFCVDSLQTSDSMDNHKYH